MKDRTVFLIVLSILTLVLSSCVAVTPTAPPSQTEGASAPSEFTPFTLTDDLGREVVVTSVPERVISLAPSNSEILFYIGAGAQVVGVTKYCDYPPDACEGKEVIGGFSAKSISVEMILSLEPDIVFSGGGIHQSVIEALEQANVTVYAMEPESLDSIYAAILTAGRITGHEAEALVEEMKQRVAAIEEKVGGIPEEERVTIFYEVWDEPLMAAGPTSFIGQVISLAGGVNIFADVEEQYPKVSPEAVVDRNPDAILGPDTHGDALLPEKIAARSGWDGIKAIQEGNIFIIEGGMASRAGPRVVDLLETIAQMLYPEHFQE